MPALLGTKDEGERGLAGLLVLLGKDHATRVRLIDPRKRRSLGHGRDTATDIPGARASRDHHRQKQQRHQQQRQQQEEAAQPRTTPVRRSAAGRQGGYQLSVAAVCHGSVVFLSSCEEGGMQIPLASPHEYKDDR